MKKRSIVIEETVAYSHEVIIEYEDEAELDDMLKKIFHNVDKHPCYNFDDWVDRIREVATINESIEDVNGETTNIDYEDDYEYKR